MICKKCRREIPEDAVFCPQCGKKQTAAPRKRHAKRPAGSGTINKVPGRRANPYRALFPAIWRDGRKLQKPLGYYPTYEAADAALREALAIGRDAHERTLEDMYRRFISGNYFAGLSASGQESHRSAYRYMQDIGATRIVDVSTETFQRIVDDMRGKGLSRETMAKVRNLASLLCKECMRAKLMDVNFGALVQLPRQEKAKRRSFTLRELSRIWAAAEAGDRAAMAVILLCYTGMRPSELLGMRIEKHLRLRKGWTYAQTGSKTEAGRNRIIPIPSAVLPFLHELQADRDFGFLIPTPTGLQWREENWRKREFYPLMQTMQIKDAVPYTCRHTYSNLQKRRNVDPEIMMEIMGHTDYSTTVEHYHTTSEDDIDRICSAADGLSAPEKAG